MRLDVLTSLSSRLKDGAGYCVAGPTRCSVSLCALVETGGRISELGGDGGCGFLGPVLVGVRCEIVMVAGDYFADAGWLLLMWLC